MRFVAIIAYLGPLASLATAVVAAILDRWRYTIALLLGALLGGAYALYAMSILATPTAPGSLVAIILIGVKALWVTWILDCAGVWLMFISQPGPKPGHCQFCGYDLRASPGSCPECGRKPGR